MTKRTCASCYRDKQPGGHFEMFVATVRTRAVSIPVSLYSFFPNSDLRGSQSTFRAYAFGCVALHPRATIISRLARELTKVLHRLSSILMASV